MTAGPAILAVGGAHVDRRGVVAGRHRSGASNPGTMREEVGGGAFNALRNACRLGARGSILSVRGGDLAGNMVADAIREAGIADLSAVFLDRTTPSYTAILEETGDLVTGFADMALYEFAFEKQLRRHPFRDALAACDGVLTDANLPEAALVRLAQAVDKPLFAIGISPAKIGRLRPILARLSALFMNRNEALALTGLDAEASDAGLTDAIRAAGIERAVVTRGEKPVLAVADGGSARFRPAAAASVRDVTGAGDALAGVTMLRMLQGLDFANALRHGIAAASLTVESPNVVADYDDQRLARRLADLPEPTGAST